MKIIHTADIHYHPKRQIEALASFGAIYQTALQEAVHLVVISGDLFDRGIVNSTGSGFPALVDAVQRILFLCPIVAVRGTPTHDVAGCYDVLCELQADYPFVVIEADGAYGLTKDGKILPANESAQLLILGCGEPSKEWFLAGKQLGRDEATEAIQEGMRKILLGLAARRKEYPDIPCIMVYHGMVEGATIKEGVYVRPGEITIGRDDLALVGANYYALGHIHLAQQIGDLPAYYAGSAYPVNWGETEQKSCRFVVLESGPPQRFVASRTIPFPHPPRKKIIADTQLRKDDDGFAGFQTWMVVRGTKEELRTVDQDQALAWLLENGALEGSRVTTELIPTETVRAGEIQEAKGLREKVAVWAENSSQPITDAILAKADALEAEAQREGLASSGAHIRIDSLSVRGPIGLHKGLGLDELTIDFNRYDPGVIALVGRNGCGKTTLIENMHPFPEMLTRSGKLADHFCLKDSHRDLHFTDERTGDKYRAFIQIDGVGQAGRCDYHLYRNGTPLTDGRKESYVEAVTKLFGSLSLYLRSAFVSQKPTKQNPELSDATKGEKKALFRELAGLDYLQLYAETAKEKAKALAETIIFNQGRVAPLEELLATLPAKEQELQAQRGALVDVQHLLKVWWDRLGDATERHEQFRERAEAHKAVTAKLEDVQKRRGDLQKQHFETCTAIDGYQQAQEGREDAEKRIAEHDKLTAQERKLTDERAKVQAERERLWAEYRDAKDAVDAAEREIQQKRQEISEKIADLEKKKALSVQRIDGLTDLLAEKITCPKCGHVFARDQEKLQEQLEAEQQKVLDIDLELHGHQAGLHQRDEQLSAVRFNPPIEPELPTFDGIALAGIKLRIDDLRVDEARATLQAADVAGAKIEEAQKLLKNIKGQQQSLEASEEELSEKLDPDAPGLVEQAKQDMEDIKRTYDEHKQRQAGITVSIEHIEREIQGITERKQELANVKKAIEASQAEETEWLLLQQACGPDGIQALELDAMGPGIAEVANRLLEAAYGSRFQIEFRTTRIGGAGSKRKQIEDFAIWIYDNADGTEQQMETLSGGESVWIKRALYDAFAIIRDRNTGLRFLTAFADEADGALDPEARVAYFRMLEAAHHEAGRAHTIVITHSPEAQELIGQKIEMEELKAEAADPADLR